MVTPIGTSTGGARVGASTIRPYGFGTGSGGGGGTFLYRRPGGVDLYFRPGGVDKYFRP